MPSRQEYTQEWLGEIPSSSRPGNLKTKCLLDKALKCPQNHLWNTSLILCLKHFVSRFYVTDKGYDSQKFHSKTRWYHFKESKTKQSPRQICVTDSSKVTIFSKKTHPLNSSQRKEELFVDKQLSYQQHFCCRDTDKSALFMALWMHFWFGLSNNLATPVRFFNSIYSPVILFSLS